MADRRATFGGEKLFRLFVSSPGDVDPERRRLDLVVERLNGAFAGRVRIETVRWETGFYSAHDTYQPQIPHAADCDIIVAVFGKRLGTTLPPTFPPLPSGEPYPSGTAYEVLSAIDARKAGQPLPDIYVFRSPGAPSVPLDAPDRAEIELQWHRLQNFFEKLFLNSAGEFLAAFQSYASTDDFAGKAEECLRQWLARRGFLPQGVLWDRLQHGSPFPGLAAFEANRESVFFGRRLAVAHAIERLRAAGAGPRHVPALLMIGASGSGKSSLLRAGLLPCLTQPGTIPEIDLWRIAVVTAGAEPFAALANALFNEAALGAELRAGTFRTKELLAKQLSGDPDIAVAPLRDALEQAAARRQRETGFDAPRPARLALALDQVERLFSEAKPEAAEAMAKLLAALVRHDLIYLIVALRSDAYPSFQAVEAFRALRDAGETFDLVPPTAVEMEEIVARPVALCDPPLAFEQREGRSLSALLVADAQGGDALPLLQVTLARLFAAEAARGDGVLRFADYAGMDKAVSDTANEALATLDEAARAELPALVAGLATDIVTDPRTGRPVPVVAPLDRRSFEASRPARVALIEAFVRLRLLTAEGDDTSQRVRPVHEALLRIWPEAVAIIGETAALIRARHTLEPLVRAWSEAPAPAKPGYLEIAPALLASAHEVLARFTEDLPPAMRDFIAEATTADLARRNREREEQERRIRDAQAVATANRRTARRTTAGLIVAIVLAAVAAWQWQDARAQRDRAQRNLALATESGEGLGFRLSQYRKQIGNMVGASPTVVKDALVPTPYKDEPLNQYKETPETLHRYVTAFNAAAETFRMVRGPKNAQEATVIAQKELKQLLQMEPNNDIYQFDAWVTNMRSGEAATGGNQTLSFYQRSIEIMEKLANSDPDNTRWQRDLGISHERVAEVEHAQNNLLAALRSYQASLAISERLSKADPSNLDLKHDLMTLHFEIGSLQKDQGDLSAALTSYRTLIDISGMQFDYASDDFLVSVVSASYDSIGDVQKTQGNLLDALNYYRRALAMRRNYELNATNPYEGLMEDIHLSYNKIGDLQQALGDLPGALSSYWFVLERMSRRYSTDPEADTPRVPFSTLPRDLSLEYQQTPGPAPPASVNDLHDLVVLYDRIGGVRKTLGDLPAALSSYRTVLELLTKLNEAHDIEFSPELGRDLAATYNNIGEIQLTQGDLPAALSSYQTSLAFVGKYQGFNLFRSDDFNFFGEHGDSLRVVALAHEGMARIAARKNEKDEAIHEFQIGRNFIAGLVSKYPTNATLSKDLARFDSEIASLRK